MGKTVIEKFVKILGKTPTRRWSLIVLVILAAGAALTAYYRTPSRTVFVGPPSPLVTACPSWAAGLCEPSENLFTRSEEDPAEETLVSSVKPGQTLAGILSGYLAPGRLASLDDPKDFSFSRIQSGQPYRLTLRDQALVTFEYDISPTETLIIHDADGELEARVETHQCEVRQTVITGTVESSLFESVTEAGGDAEMAVALAEIFSCDIDFCRDVQKGDAFRAVVEKRYVEGEFVGLGRVLAAEFINQGKAYLGFSRIGDNGRLEYFDADGRPLRKTFLRAPLSFLRITSRFTKSRLHPILHVRKPHYGVDYAAPTGTPVWSVGDGVVVERGRNPAAGNYVTVRHGDSYVTRYNHFSRFAKGLAKGTKVAQGQVIGYVGMTGYATGPHLDFRIYKNGQPVNALANPEMTTDPLPSSKMAAFSREAKRLTVLMRQAPGTRNVADREPSSSKHLQ